MELTTFMEKVSSSKSEVETDSELGQLNIQDWARLWVQVIHELRSGVRLKKTEYTRTPIEYELTPYEILMDDIRSKRYKLNKVSERRPLATGGWINISYHITLTGFSQILIRFDILCEINTAVQL